MDDQQWNNTMEKGQGLAWLLIIALIIPGYLLGKPINTYLYQSASIDPLSTYWVALLCYVAGAFLWSSKASAQVSAGLLSRFMRTLWRRLFRAKRIDNQEVKNLIDDVFDEDYQRNLIRTLRQATRSFITAGLLAGLTIGLLQGLLTKAPFDFANVALLGGYGLVWGYIWYRMAWFGRVPMLAFE